MLMEELEAFLETVKRGDAFDLLSLAKCLLLFKTKLTPTFSEAYKAFIPNNLRTLQVQALDIPDDKQLHRKLLHWFSAEQWSMAELVDIIVAGRPWERIADAH